MQVLHDRYRVTRDLSVTLYGCVLACQDTQGEQKLEPKTALVSPVVVKQVSLERMASVMRDFPSDGHMPDNPFVEKEYKDSFLDQEALYLVMEYCADGDLYDYLSRRKQRTMSCSNALSIVVGETYDPKTADVWSLGIVFFIMLTGSPLVSLASMSVKSFRTLQQAGIETVLQAWGIAPTMSDSAVDLLSGMLQIDPKKRLTVAQVLEHDALNTSGSCTKTT
ncbi:Protein kinase-like domain [Phytophthora cactorum]|nr:Protein kinase-like domain [Phytophthora cactorum]